MKMFWKCLTMFGECYENFWKVSENLIRPSSEKFWNSSEIIRKSYEKLWKIMKIYENFQKHHLEFGNVLKSSEKFWKCMRWRHINLDKVRQLKNPTFWNYSEMFWKCSEMLWKHCKCSENVMKKFGKLLRFS